MSELLKRIDARTKLAGSNRMEILLFSLGRDQRSGVMKPSASTCSKCVRSCACRKSPARRTCRRP